MFKPLVPDRQQLTIVQTSYYQAERIVDGVVLAQNLLAPLLLDSVRHFRLLRVRGLVVGLDH